MTSSVFSIQSIVNNSSYNRLVGCTPVTVHKGVDSDYPITLALTCARFLKVDSINKSEILQNLQIYYMLIYIDSTHKEVLNPLSDARHN